ncbi:MAG: isoaspartyl peptidase/L-asparaginase [Conexivisphaerales archaeon]
MKARIILHGGAGEWKIDRARRERVEETLRAAVKEGLAALRKGSALDGLLEAISYMEDSGMFDAGRGAYPNIEHDIEFDAGIMDGSSLKVGAVAAVRNVRNPILLAYNVMKNTNHCLIAGSGAERLAKAFGLWEEMKPSREADERFRNGFDGYLQKEMWIKKLQKVYRGEGDTIGGVAIDQDGNLASATSTGGTIFKLPGRVGDSPLVGSGFYAMNGHGGCSATGVGEDIMRYCLSARIVNDLNGRTDPFKVLVRELDEMKRLLGKSSAGAVCMDSSGRGAAYTLTPAIAVAAGYGSIVAEAKLVGRDDIAAIQRKLRMESV